MKRVTFQPINEQQEVHTGSDVLQALLARDLKVLMACGGKGMCSTCHVFVREGMSQLTPMTPRETKTLAYITGARESSRLACQCRVLGEGVVIDLPDGMYIERAEDLLSMVGTRAAQNVLHPLNGSVLVAAGKIITRSRIEELKRLNAEVEAVRRQV